MALRAPKPQFEFLAGNVALDFVNTLDNRPNPARWHENLRSLEDLLRWAHGANIIRSSEVATVRIVPDRQRRRLLAKALTLREVICRIFTAVARSQPPDREDLELLNRFVAEAMGSMRLARQDQHFRWEMQGANVPDRVLHAVTRAAADLLTSAQADRVRECASGTCRWLFVDTSKNSQRRWCDMRTCGNRAKVRRFHAAHRLQ
jgi:predicted RNA-binding Zn ribbon-like protein